MQTATANYELLRVGETVFPKDEYGIDYLVLNVHL